MKVLPNGQLINEQFDGLNRRVLSSGYRTDQQLVSDIQYEFSYEYDAAGNLRRMEEVVGSLDAREVTMTYDNLYRLTEETAITAGATVNTTYQYDSVGNRLYKGIDNDGDGFDDEHWTTVVDNIGLNQIQTITHSGGSIVGFTYDPNGNRSARIEGATSKTFAYDGENRLIEVQDGAATYRYGYDYRTRRVWREENGAADHIVFSGGVSVQEYDTAVTGQPDVEYVRGSGLGGGIGSILYSLRGGAPGYTHYNSRGDVVAKSDSTAALTWQASYEGFGSRTQELGINPDRQRANTREETIWGALYENMRWRDLETGQYYTRDPAGFVDGPNLYAYVTQNPWTAFDPTGLYLMDMMPDWYQAAANNPIAALVTPGAMALSYVDAPIDAVIEGGETFENGVNHFTNPDQYAYEGGKVQTLAMGTVGVGIGVAVIASEIADGLSGGGKKKAAKAVVDVAKDLGEKKGREAVKDIIEDSSKTTTNAGNLIAESRGKGKLGELNSGIEKNSKRIPSASGKKEYRIPDGMDEAERHLTEVKNVNNQSLTSQIKDNVAHATRGGEKGQVDVIVDKRTKISKPLEDEHLDPSSPINVIRKDLNQ